MRHKMKLNPDPFERIASGRKTIELRVYDEKRQKVNIGDEIEFTEISELNRKVVVKVVGLLKYQSFEELYKSIDLTRLGHALDEISSDNYKDMEAYYSLDEQRQYGVLGIEIELL